MLMSITPEERTKLEEIMHGMKCPKNFKCAMYGFKPLCKVKDVSMGAFNRDESTLECLEKDPAACPFASSIQVGNEVTYFCQCPLRVYIAKKLKQ
jgi:hypothetical protein